MDPENHKIYKITFGFFNHQKKNYPENFEKFIICHYGTRSLGITCKFYFSMKKRRLKIEKKINYAAKFRKICFTKLTKINISTKNLEKNIKKFE